MTLTDVQFMQRLKVFLFTKNAMLHKWCARELNDLFQIETDAPDAYSALLNARQLPSCVLMDYDFCSESLQIQNYNYISNTLHLSFIFLFCQKNQLVQKRNIFPNAYFISIYSDCGSLSALLQTLVHHVCSLAPKVIVPQKELQLDLPSLDENCATSDSMEVFYKKVQRVARSEEPVLLLGESGSGKSYTARRIHKLSRFKNGPYCSLNVAELTSAIAESQLFGTVKGAFTDAQNMSGLFEQAQEGTLLLDEVAELDLCVQTKLLDVLETKKFRRLGSMKELRFDTRLIFATNADLHERARQGLFRADLLYRIDVLRIHVPPLREHRSDIPRLAKEFANRKNRTLSSCAIDALMSYSWPGNIRQLNNYVNRACVLSAREQLTADDFDFIR